MTAWSQKLGWVFAASLAGVAGCGEAQNSNTSNTPCPTATWRVPLEDDAGTSVGDGGINCNARCGGPNVSQVARCEIAAGDGGRELVCFVVTACPGGRSTEGIELPPLEGSSAGAVLAAMSAMEAASVTAFRRLARELEAHGAPASLPRDARQAACDERRHARAMRALARRYGASPRSPRGSPAGPRSLAALARENAVEGCVRETWGALLAAWQAQRAEDPQARATFTAIADDERRHAALAWEIAAWAEPRLTADEADAARRAREGSWEALRAEIEGADTAGDPRLGMPSAAEARALLATLRDGLAAVA
jgi:hypothetical protein